MPGWSRRPPAFRHGYALPAHPREDNEDIYFPGGPDHDWQQVLHFSELIERVQSGPLVFNAVNNMPFGVGWNITANFSQGLSFGGWSADLEGIHMGASLELPYANASDREVNQETAFGFGQDLAKASTRVRH